MGVVVLVLSITLGVGWATALIMSASSRTPPITDSTKDLLSSVGGVLAGGISAYIGAAVVSRRRHKSDEQDEPDEPDG